ncbi:MAG: phage/plasmid primase, P4 family [Verrucomicrobiota bacterium]
MKAKSKKVGASREIRAKKDEVKKDAAELPVEVEMTDPVFIQYGPPFLGEGNKIIVNQRAVAAKCAQLHQIKYDETLKAFQRYDVKQGLWVSLHEVHACRLMGDLLLDLGEEFGHQEAVFQGKTALLKSLCEMLKIYRFECAVHPTTGLFHASNGILNLNGDKPKLVPHAPEYPFVISSGIHYDPKARCPRFLDEFLGEALGVDDIELAQKYCGSMLLGANTCHGILLIRGTPGGGKSTLVSVIEKMLSETNVAHLRTKHLNGRFETSAFLGKRVLVGKDVPGDTLSENGARLLKSLVGGDLLQAEIKYNPTKQMLRGNFHVVIASNTNLRIALDGDAGAWHRRLLVVDFDREKPAKPISDYADVLIANEASGILTWLVEGAMKFKAEMEAEGKLAQSKKQMQRVDALLYDSDSVDSFIEQRLVEDKKADVSSEELLVDYHETCNEQGWRAVSGQEFKRRVPDLICHRFLLHRRNDIMRDKRSVRGYKGLTLR